MGLFCWGVLWCVIVVSCHECIIIGMGNGTVVDTHIQFKHHLKAVDMISRNQHSKHGATLAVCKTYHQGEQYDLDRMWDYIEEREKV